MNLRAITVVVCATRLLQVAALTKRQTQSEGKCPSLFAAVLTKDDNTELRAGIREMWREAGSDWGEVKAKFLMCGLASNVSKALQREINLHGDIVMMDCEEGYLNGILTKKSRGIDANLPRTLRRVRAVHENR